MILQGLSGPLVELLRGYTEFSMTEARYINAFGEELPDKGTVAQKKHVPKPGHASVVSSGQSEQSVNEVGLALDAWLLVLNVPILNCSNCLHPF